MDSAQSRWLGPDVIEAELKIRAALLAGDFTGWARGDGHFLREDLARRPQRLFLVRLGDTWHVGYMTISDLVVEHGMAGVVDNRVRWHNLLGVLTSLRTSESDVRLGFRPLDEAARRAAFQAITPMTELVYPFVQHRTPGHELTGEGWEVDAAEAALLDLGEEHIRRYTRELFGPRLAEAASDIVAYDPACSTGRFLSDFASLNPARIRTVGQDLSPQMADLARARLERVHVGDAEQPAVAPFSVDILFSRFLNAEVVSTAQARRILPRLALTLKPGGTLVLLGHTPLLLDAADLADTGLRVVQTTARQDDHVFQYYVCHTQRLRSA
ncbi:class I SAM-dependent methyltransferase [Kutzneria sp. NPDC052558]|uniref:class I SAM-dependent methyltransferase n=1 Tax=Kutzneria sp. NPDC052558 TaxID=3364121 RepID=UPI0037C55509